MAIKKLLLVGGSGQIGLKIIDSLKSKFNLYVFDNKILNIKEIKFIKGNCLNNNDLKKLPKNFDATIFLIGKKVVQKV